MPIYQHELRECLPGTLGGLALARQCGHTYMAALGASGGTHTVQRKGHAYMASLARKGAEARWKKARQPITTMAQVAGEQIALYRHIPYWPARTRRKKPLWIRITLWEDVL